MSTAVHFNHVRGICHRKRLRALGASVKGSDLPFGLVYALEQMLWIEDTTTLAYPNTEQTQTILASYDEIVTVQMPMNYPSPFENPFYADLDSFSTSFILNDQSDLSNCTFTPQTNEGHSRVSFGSAAIVGSENVEFLSATQPQGEAIEFYVSVDIDDATSNDATIIFTPYKAHKKGDTTGDVALSGGSVTFSILNALGTDLNSVSGSVQGSGTWGAVWYEISILPLSRVKTSLIVPKDDSKIYETPSGETRYTGEQRFYLFILNVEEDHIEEFIVPESVYYDSTLGNAIMNENIASLERWGLDDLGFSEPDPAKTELSFSIRGVLSATVSPTQRNAVINYLTTNKTGAVPYESLDITGEFFTVGLQEDVTANTPIEAPKLSELSEITVVTMFTRMEEQIIEVTETITKWIPWPFGDWARETVTTLVHKAVEIIEWTVTLGVALITNPAEAVRMLEEAANFVWDAYVGFVQSALEFAEAVGNALAEMAMAAFKAIADFAAAVADAVMSALSWLIDWLIGIAKCMFESVFKPIIDALSDWVNGIVSTTVNGFNYIKDGKTTEASLSMVDVANAFLNHQVTTSLLIIFGVILAISLILTPFTITFSFIIGVVISMIMTIILNAVGATIPSDDTSPVSAGPITVIFTGIISCLGLSSHYPQSEDGTRSDNFLIDLVGIIGFAFGLAGFVGATVYGMIKTWEKKLGPLGKVKEFGKQVGAALLGIGMGLVAILALPHWQWGDDLTPIGFGIFSSILAFLGWYWFHETISGSPVGVWENLGWWGSLVSALLSIILTAGFIGILFI